MKNNYSPYFLISHLQLDSRTGLKLDTAYDRPRVLVADVTKQLGEKWNIK